MNVLGDIVLCVGFFLIGAGLVKMYQKKKKVWYHHKYGWQKIDRKTGLIKKIGGTQKWMR